jgi:hypothetical protein
MGLNRLIKNSRFPSDAFAVISEESMIPLCEKYAIQYTFYKNNPLGEKKNYGLNEAMKLEWDYLIELGSDDILKDEILDLYTPYFGKEHFFGAKDFCLVNSVDGDCRRLKSDTVYGMGRCFSREILQKVYGVEVLALETIMQPGRSVIKDSEGFLKPDEAEQLQKQGKVKITSKPKFKLWRDDLNRSMDNNSTWTMHMQRVAHKTVKSERPLGVDIKSDENIWPFNKNIGVPYDLELALDGISDKEKKAIYNLMKVTE